MWYAIVSFGGAFPKQTVFRSKQDAIDAVVQADRDTAAGGGDLYCDLQVLMRARVYQYDNEESAQHADISDTTDNSRGQQTKGFVGIVWCRS